MRKKLFLFAVFCCVQLFSQNKTFKESEYYFYENKGQIIDQDGKENPDVKYLFHSAGLNVQLRSNGFSYDIYQVEKLKENVPLKKDKNSIDQKQEKVTYKYHRIDIELINSNINHEIAPEDQSPDFDNFYNIPNKPNGIIKVHRFKKITYKNIYNNIDLVFFKPKDTLKPIEYNFIVKPGGKISDIKMKFNGAETFLKNDKIVMKVRFGEMQENIPLSWLLDGNIKQKTSINYKQIDRNVYGFAGKQDSYNKTLIIDPVPTPLWIKNLPNWVWHSNNLYNRILANANQEVYTSFTTIARYNVATSTYTVMDFDSQNYGYVSKFDSSGNKMWGTYIGNHHNSGDETNVLKDIVVNNNNEVYAVGHARDTQAGTNTITTPGAHKEHSSYVNPFYQSDNTDAFIVKLNNNGVKIWGTYFGGDYFDTINSLLLDSNQNLILAGLTSGNNGIATSNASISTNPYLYNGYGFIAKFSPNGQQLYGSYFGLRYGIKRIAKDNSDNIYVTGDVHRNYNGSGSGTAGTHQSTVIGESNAYLAKLNSNFQFLWGTYFGGKNGYGVQYNSNEGSTYSMDLKIDFDNNIILLGNTDSHEKISTPGTHQTQRTSNLGNDIFLTKFNPSGNQIWGTYFGATTGNTVNDDLAYGLSVDNNNDLVFSGQTSNNVQIATSNGFLPNNGGGYHSGFFTKFNTLGNQIWGSYYYSAIHSIYAKDNNIYTFGGTSTNNNFAKFYDCIAGISATSNSPVCINSTVQLNATGGTTYSWTGPNGFVSNLQNPTIPNATAAHSGTYTCQVTGSGACDGSFTVNVTVGDNIAPVPTIATLADVTGDCHTIVTNIPTATDNCAGTITATTTDPLSYSLPGNYIIHWNYNDGNGNTFTQNQNVIISSPALPTSANLQQGFCATNQPKVSDIQITGQNIIWYNAAGTVLVPSTPLVTGTYYASQTINGCESDKAEFQITVNSTPRPTGNSMQDFCESANPKVSSLVVTGTDLKFYDAAGNLLPLTTSLVNGQIYYVTQTINGCESAKFSVAVTLSLNNVPANNYSETFCNSTIANTMVVNLSAYESNIIVNPTGYVFTYTDNLGNPIGNPTNYTLNIGLNIINVKVATPDGCFKIAQLSLTVNPKPNITLPEKLDFCEGKNITLDAGSGFASYLWNTGATTQTITISTPGNYTVAVKNNFGCESTATIAVSYSVLAQIVSVNINNHSATVILSATGNYEYSLDNLIWQDSNVFNNLSMGEYTVYVRTKSGCIIGQKPFSIFNIPNAITPNGDGINDLWKINGLENYPGTEVSLYDRSGIAIFKEVIKNKKPFEWEAKLSGRPLPTGSYWYIIKVSDGRIYTGWLLIKNRE